jgi:peptide/nickel transport system substrate-binding protein
VRNPRFSVWSESARPDGYPDEIVWTVIPKVEDRLNSVVRGTTDAMAGVPFDRPDPARIAQLRAQYPAQVHPWLSGTVFVFMNNLLPPFDSRDVRRAVNLAIDRSKLVDLLGGPEQADVTCQVLLPNTQGYEPYCPYTVDPNAGGTWTAPDVTTARSLVAASGRAGAHVTVTAFGRFAPVATYVVGVLDALGFKATLRIADQNAVIGELVDPIKGPQVQSVVLPWFPDFPAASATVLPNFSCKDPAAFVHFCDAALSRQIQSALDLQQTDRSAAAAAWAAVDRTIVDLAPAAAIVNQRESDLVSARVGNYQHHPEWTILYDQLWVK